MAGFISIMNVHMLGKKAKLVVVTLLLGVSAVGASLLFDGEKDNLQASVLHVDLEKEESNGSKRQVAPFDLAIESVQLKKVSNPVVGNNFHKYEASVTVKNVGGNVSGAKAALKTEDSAGVFLLENSDNGLNLRNGEEFVLEGFPIFLDGDYNGFRKNLVLDSTDTNKGNNIYAVDFVELEAKIGELRLEYDFEENLNLEYYLEEVDLEDSILEIYSIEQSEVNFRKKQYYELSDKKGIVDYFVVKNSSSVIDNDKWERQVVELDDLQRFDVDLWRGKYFYLKMTDEKTGNYVVSDVIGLIEERLLNKAELAKLFVELNGITVMEAGDEGEWYERYVFALYENGLISDGEYFLYSPDEPAYREDILKLALDYFDVNLSELERLPRFVDVKKNTEGFIFAQSFAVNEVSDNLGDYLHLGQGGSREFLNYLLNGYK